MLTEIYDEPGNPVNDEVHGCMDAHGGLASVPSVIRLGGLDFEFESSLAPDRDAAGIIKEFGPQRQYATANIVPLHKHGHGTFCRFRVRASKRRTGIYALAVAGSICYIGECADLSEQFNSRGYGTISPRNCYMGGQATNCKINRRVLDVSKAGGRVDLYFHPTSLRKTVEKQLIASYSPLWNDR